MSWSRVGAPGGLEHGPVLSVWLCAFLQVRRWLLRAAKNTDLLRQSKSGVHVDCFCSLFRESRKQPV